VTRPQRTWLRVLAAAVLSPIWLTGLLGLLLMALPEIFVVALLVVFCSVLDFAETGKWRWVEL
jgi:uncharacterized RDD family membrane protein YckC